MQPLWKTIRRFLKKLKIELPDDTVIPFPKEMKTGSRRFICTPMFIAELFTIAKIWKQPNCPSRNEWIKKM